MTALLFRKTPRGNRKNRGSVDYRGDSAPGKRGQITASADIDGNGDLANSL
jgi:hypothetical protein